MQLEFSLDQNYPNPFNPTTTIEYGLPREVNLHLAVYDNLWRELIELVNTRQQPGYYMVAFDARSFTSGVYYLQIRARQTDGGQAGDFVRAKKLLLVK